LLRGYAAAAPNRSTPANHLMKRSLLSLVATCLLTIVCCVPVPCASAEAANPAAPSGDSIRRRENPAPSKTPTLVERAAARDRALSEERAQAGPAPIPGNPSDYATGFPILGQAPKPRPDDSLQSFRLVDTGPYLANAHFHSVKWTNNSGRSLAIYKAYVWTGFDRGGIADVHIDLRRESDGSFIALMQWDHYGDPTLPQQGQQFDYGSPMVLDPGESVSIAHFANGVNPGWHAHHVVIVWIK
jgi:hypothetical protein